MARYQFGRGVGDFVVRPTDGLWGIGAGEVLTFWSEADGGTAYTDLLDASGSPIAAVTVDGQGRIPSFTGPDSVAGMWAEAGGTRAWIKARGTGPGGDGGGGAFTALTRIVASSTAPADVRAAAQYVCDGIADQVQIQAALDDARDNGGGEVQLTIGDFHLSAPLMIEGTDDVDVEIGIALRGQGARATMLKAGDGLTSAIHLTKVVRVVLESLGLTVAGATDGITSATTNGAASGHRSFWNSSFKTCRSTGRGADRTPAGRSTWGRRSAACSRTSRSAGSATASASTANTRTSTPAISPPKESSWNWSATAARRTRSSPPPLRG